MASSSKQETLVYYDANIWIDWALCIADGSENAVNDLFNVLNSGRRVVVVSNLLEYEVCHILRKDFTSNTEYYGSSKDNIERVQKEVSIRIKKVFERPLESLLQSKKAKRQNPDNDAAFIDNQVLEKMKNCMGRTTVISKCPKCEWRVNKDFKNECPKCGKQIEAMKKYHYSGLNGADLKHAYIAQSLGIQEFYTRDKGFLDLISDKEFSFKIKICGYDSPSKPRRTGG